MRRRPSAVKKDDSEFIPIPPAAPNTRKKEASTTPGEPKTRKKESSMTPKAKQ
jgi:hypothetical protein